MTIAFCEAKNVILFDFRFVPYFFRAKGEEGMKKAADFSTKLLLFFAKVDDFLTGCAEFRRTVAWGYKKTPDESRGLVGSVGRVRQGALRGRELSPDDWHAYARCGRE